MKLSNEALEDRVKLANIDNSYNEFKTNFSEELFKDHLIVIENMGHEAQIETLTLELEEYLSDENNSEFNNIKNVYEKIDDFNNKLKRNSNLKLKTEEIKEESDDWGNLLLKKEYSTLIDEITLSIEILDEDYKKYLATLPPPAAKGQGYQYLNVSTGRGSFGVHLIKVPLNSVKVKTVSAHSGSCSDNCATKSLADYVRENNGYAGINGSYFCPPDYGSCSGKINSFDFALYDSREGNWDNKGALSWFKTGLMTFNGSSPKFYKKSSDYGGDSVSAAISNYPSLLKDSQIVIDEGELTSYQKDVRGRRGAIGVGGENLYLALINNATVIDAAYVMQALGVKHALNLDGGGSSAMYINGGYAVGPGRSLPNAIVITK